MATSSKAPTKLFLLSAVGFACACLMWLFQHSLNSGMFETFCKTTAYFFLTGAVLSLSYAVFLRSWENDENN